jgi:ATP-grasp ribosomal peptide maturase
VTVLILASDLDGNVDKTVRVLRDRGIDVCRVNTAWFPAQLAFTAELRGDRWSGELRTPNHVLDLDEVHAVWYRNPEAYQMPVALSAPERHHASMEAKYGLGGVLSSLRTLWVNHPSRIADASYKPVQLVTAAACGLTVPDTMITNTPDAVRTFATRGETVTKLVGGGQIGEEGRRKLVFTRLVTEDDLGDLRGIEVTAHLFQGWVPKRAEARVVVIGDQITGALIHAHSSAAYVDFRSDYNSLTYELVDVPTPVLQGIRHLMRRFGLVYGALDFVVTPSGDWVFLEINPAGLYGWIEDHTGAPLTAQLADLLTKGAV